MLTLSVLGSQAFPSTEIKADPSNLVQRIKNQLQFDTGVPASKQHLFYKGKELKNNHSLNASGIHKDTLLFMTMSANADSVSNQPVCLRILANSPPYPADFEERLNQARQGLAAGLAPRLATEGTGGTYFLRSAKQQRNVAVFKPADEEPFAPGNPRGFSGHMGSEGLKPGILSGEGHVREVVAFALDHDHFLGVPPTVLAELTHPALSGARSFPIGKAGSLQEFVEFDEMVSDLAPQKFRAREVHKIGILDIRIVNTDRNDANILVKRRGREFDLIPIDHAYSLPDTLQLAWTDWVWFDWPQAKLPLDEETKQYVMNIDINADIELLRSFGIREPCLHLMRITNMLLQKGVAAGLTLYQIAGIILRREDENKPSELEIMCSQAAEIARKVGEHVSPVWTANSNDSPLNNGVKPTLWSRNLSYTTPSPRFGSLPSPVTDSSKNGTLNGNTTDSSIKPLSMHRSISHTNFHQLDDSKARNGFPFSAPHSVTRRHRLNINTKGGASDRKIPFEPSSPDGTGHIRSSSEFSAQWLSASGEVFFDFLSRLLDQAIMLCLNKTGSTPASSPLIAHPKPMRPMSGDLSLLSDLHRISPNLSPHRHALNTGFDFGAFSDSTESPMVVSHSTSQLSFSPLSLAGPNITATTPAPPMLPQLKVDVPVTTRTACISSNAVLDDVSYSSALKSPIFSSLPSPAVQQPSLSNSSSPLPSWTPTSSTASFVTPTNSPAASTVSTAAAVKVPYRPPHLRARLTSPAALSSPSIVDSTASMSPALVTASAGSLQSLPPLELCSTMPMETSVAAARSTHSTSGTVSELSQGISLLTPPLALSSTVLAGLSSVTAPSAPAVTSPIDGVNNVESDAALLSSSTSNTPTPDGPPSTPLEPSPPTVRPVRLVRAPGSSSHSRVHHRPRASRRRSRRPSYEVRFMSSAVRGDSKSGYGSDASCSEVQVC